MPIYTRQGDAGKTGLYTPKGAVRRVAKDDPRIEAYGTTDELNALMGLLGAHIDDPSLKDEMRLIQSVLFHVGYDLSALGDPPPAKVTAEDALHLEERIDAMTQTLPPLRAFILPAGPAPAAMAHVARTVCRRAERRAVTLSAQAPINAHCLTYLNRLSDYLFTLARYLAREDDPVEWRT